MNIDDDVATPPTEEETTTVTKKPRAKKAKTKKAKTKVKAKKTKKAAGKRGGKLPLDETRKDKVAAALRIRAGTPRAKLVEHLAKANGKMISADALAKLVGDRERRTIQHFVMVIIPRKIERYGLKYEVLNDREGNYSLKV